MLGPLGAARGLDDVDAALTSEALSAVMNGNHPLTGLALRRADADATRVVALDLTYSAPKSVSVVWAFADDELRAQLEAAVERSASTIMSPLRSHPGTWTEIRLGVRAAHYDHQPPRPRHAALTPA